jgi:hypothetical protein
MKMSIRALFQPMDRDSAISARFLGLAMAGFAVLSAALMAAALA